MKILKSLSKILYLIIFLSFLIFLNTKVLSGNVNTVIINEIFFDPVGTDNGKEWIELYNYGDSDITFTNWKIMVAGSGFTLSSLVSGTIPPKSYYLICETSVTGCNVNVSKIAMQNGGGNTDALSITDSNNVVIDQVFYDLPNTNALTDFLGVVVTETAAVGINGESLGRLNHIDTNNSFNDFYVFKTPTPGSINTGDNIDEELPQTGDTPLFIPISLLIIIFFGILMHKNNLVIFSNGKSK